MLFVIIGHDVPNSKDHRMKVRPLHLEYVRSQPEVVKLGGALLTDDSQGMLGSILIIDVADKAAAEEWSKNDPYRREGVFGEVEIRPFRAATVNMAPVSH
jgi:uncharacterized protein YciI